MIRFIPMCMVYTRAVQGLDVCSTYMWGRSNFFFFDLGVQERKKHCHLGQLLQFRVAAFPQVSTWNFDLLRCVNPHQGLVGGPCHD